jgi:hypothetical protein
MAKYTAFHEDAWEDIHGNCLVTYKTNTRLKLAN